MPAQMTINSKPLLDKLKAMSDKRHIQVVNQALREGAKVFQAAVIEEAPERVDDAPKSDALPPGALKHDVVLRKVAHAPEYQVRFGALTAHVASWVSNGHRLVRGGSSSTSTSGKQRKSKKATGHTVGYVEGDSFFPRAYETAVEDAAKAAADSLKRLIKKKWKSK